MGITEKKKEATSTILLTPVADLEASNPAAPPFPPQGAMAKRPRWPLSQDPQRIE